MICELNFNPYEGRNDVLLNGCVIGHVFKTEKRVKIYDPETPEEKAEREEHNRTHRYAFRPTPFHWESVYYWTGKYYDSYGRYCEIDSRFKGRTPWEARNAVRDAWLNAPDGLHKEKRVKVAYLPAGDDSDFYPTPAALAGRMFRAVKNWGNVKTVLEPSAGKGDLLDSLKAFSGRCGVSVSGTSRKYKGYRRELVLDVDCIEKDQNLRYILQGKGYRVVHDDFLTLNDKKRYDLIIMNPPFSDGDKHLLKAIDMQKGGGQIVCLLNAETLRNPCTNSRHLLMQKLKEYGANIQYIKNAFAKAERKTNVDIALISVSIPAAGNMESEFFERMRKAKEYTSPCSDSVCYNLTSGNMIERMIRDYEIERDASIAFIEEYRNLKPYIMKGTTNYRHPILSVRINDEDTIDVNAYLRSVRCKYWCELLNREDITGKLTSGLKSEFLNSVEKMQDYDFSLFNIEQVIVSINAQICQGIEDQVMSLFETLSAKHSWYPECENNIHYFNGWKTNKAHKVSNKVILPINGFSSGYGWTSSKLDSYQCSSVFMDLEKTLDYIDGGNTLGHLSAADVIRNAAEYGSTKNIDFKYFTATFYKKGTTHIKFKDQRIVDALNIYAAQNRGWLPPYYGKVRYEDMDPEGQQVIDEFQGRDAYEKVMENPGCYLIDTSKNASNLLAAV